MQNLSHKSKTTLIIVCRRRDANSKQPFKLAGNDEEAFAHKNGAGKHIISVRAERSAMGEQIGSDGNVQRSKMTLPFY